MCRAKTIMTCGILKDIETKLKGTIIIAYRLHRVKLLGETSIVWQEGKQKISMKL